MAKIYSYPEICDNCNKSSNWGRKLYSYNSGGPGTYLFLCNDCDKSEVDILIKEADLETYQINPYLRGFRNQYSAYSDNGKSVFLRSNIRAYLMKKHKIRTDDGLEKLMLRFEQEKKSKVDNIANKMILFKKFKNELIEMIRSRKFYDNNTESTINFVCDSVLYDNTDLQMFKKFLEEIGWLEQNSGHFLRIYRILYGYMGTNNKRILQDSQIFAIKDYMDKNGDKSIADIPHSLYQKHKEEIDFYANPQIGSDWNA